MLTIFFFQKYSLIPSHTSPTHRCPCCLHPAHRVHTQHGFWLPRTWPLFLPHCSLPWMQHSHSDDLFIKPLNSAPYKTSLLYIPSSYHFSVLSFSVPTTYLLYENETKEFSPSHTHTHGQSRVRNEDLIVSTRVLLTRGPKNQ